jgi:hypothetical protein
MLLALRLKTLFISESLAPLVPTLLSEITSVLSISDENAMIQYGGFILLIVSMLGGFGFTDCFSGNPIYLNTKAKKALAALTGIIMGSYGLHEIYEGAKRNHEKKSC